MTTGLLPGQQPYDESGLSEKIKYWIDSWEDTVTNFGKSYYGLELTNLQTVTDAIIDEIEDSGLERDSTLALFAYTVHGATRDGHGGWANWPHAALKRELANSPPLFCGRHYAGVAAVKRHTSSVRKVPKSRA